MADSEAIPAPQPATSEAVAGQADGDGQDEQQSVTKTTDGVVGNGDAVAGKPEKELYPMANWKYDTFLWTMSILADLFFREIHPRSSWKIPRTGPVLFVAAPHNNQFVDALILQRTLQREAKRRVSLLIAQKSVHGFIGWGSRQVGAVPVGRPQDSAKPAKGTIYLPEPIKDPSLVRGIGTSFDKEGKVAGLIFLPSVKGQSGGSANIAEIIGPEELRLQRPFKGKVAAGQLTGRTDIDDDGNFTDKDTKGCKEGFKGTKFKLAEHVDQGKVYRAVFNRLKGGGCVGIFPEGGSHDKTHSLPLKAGVAIMALGTLAEAPDCGLKIVVCGLNYFHAHKFRSRAAIEFGTPFEIPPNLVKMYQQGQRREAIGGVLDMVQPALRAVTTNSKDYDTLMLIQATRRLYASQKAKLVPLGVRIDVSRRLAEGYEMYKDDERVKPVMEAVKDYNRQLRYLNLRDHQVQHAELHFWTVAFRFLYRCIHLAVLLLGTIPGALLFSPIFVFAKWYSNRMAAEALANSVVKVKGRDVMATWKLLVSLVAAPILYNFYCILLVILFKSPRWRPSYIPETSWSSGWIFVFGWIVLPSITMLALKCGEGGMDIFKSLRPLFLCLFPRSKYNIQKLRERRAEVQAQVTELINTLGPEVYSDWENMRLIKPDHTPGSPTSPTSTSPVSPTRPRADSEHSSHGFDAEEGPMGLLRRSTTMSSRAMPRNESFSNIDRVGMFHSGTEPSSRNRSRTSSAGGGLGMSGFPVPLFSTMESEASLQEAHRKISDMMRQRGQQRRRESQSKGKGKVAADGEDEDSDSDEEKEEESVEMRKKNA